MATKKAAKKARAKKVAVKKAPAKKKVAAKKAAPAPKKAPALKAKMTKSQILASISESTGLTKKQVGSVMEELETLIERSIKKRDYIPITARGVA